MIATLLLWHVIGALSSDDGYNLTIARIAPQAGYVANYYRYFGTTEAPFDWYHELLAHLAQISTASVWMRLPATLAGIACWLLISRFVLRRLGPGKNGLAANRVAVFTAGAVFVAAWLPFNNGLRPEPLIALGVLVTWALVERAIALSRLASAAIAIIVAMLTATLAPQGLIAVAALLTGARVIAGIIRKRRGTDGLLAPLAVLAASLSLITVVVFRNQTLATVAEAARIKYKVGPTIAWYQDFLRYYFLTVETNIDGSMTRRFAVLVLLLCLFGSLVVLLRRGWVGGLARGPAWRLIGTTAVGLLLLTFTPTKWAVQFGAFAGLAGALGAVMAFSFARIGLHSRRNLTLYVTALLFVLAWATSGINGWFYVGNYGVPWYDIQPVIASHPVTSMFLTLSILTGLLAAWYHFRMDYAGHTEVKDNRRNRVLASTPLLVVAVIMVLGEVGSMAKAAVFRYPLYTTGKANLAALASGLSPNSCAMADDVLAEPDPMPGCCNRFRGRPSDRADRWAASTRSGSSRKGSAKTSSPTRWSASPAWSTPTHRPTSPTPPSATPPAPPAARARPASTDPRGAAVRTGPGPYPGDGQLRGELVGRHGDLVLVPVARRLEGQHRRPAAGRGHRGWGHLVLQRGRRLHLRAVPETGVGRHSPRRHHAAAGAGIPDRHRATTGVAQPALPAGLGPAGGQRGAHRRLRPKPESRTVVRLHPAPGAGFGNAAAVDRIEDPGVDGHCDRSQLPVPAAVLRAPRHRRTAAVPHPA
ncbi:putative arabinosyltransferase A [Mycobacterium marinum]|nr:putative arabinosyltransferase A [Mycobacterium marinum]